MRIVSRTVYVAVDGKEFKTALGCNEYEAKFVSSARREKLDNLLVRLNRIKRGKDIDSLSYRLDALHSAKEALLKKMKGKRRYLRRFAEEVKAASERYLLAHTSYNSLLHEFYAKRAELKKVEPLFCREKKGGAQ